MSTSRIPPAIENAAAAWLGRRDGGLSVEEQAAFERWLLSDARHAEAFARLERYSQALDRLSVLRAAGVPSVPAARLRRSRVWKGAGLAAAAALVLAAIFVVPRGASTSFTQVAVTRVGESRRLALPDGSSVTLNTGSEIAFAFGAQRRDVELRSGEAHFTVAKDARRPFVVRTGGVAVRAIGTAFNVRRREGEIEVVVTAGRVDVHDVRIGRSLLVPQSEAPAPALEAGQRIVVTGADDPQAEPKASEPARLSPPELARRLAWQEHRLEFGPTPLVDLVAEFNRYSHRQLVLADASLHAISVGGSFRAGDDETLVRLLETSFGIVSERRGDDILLRRGGADNRSDSSSP
jgi:transmembrane sensor